MSPEVPGAAEDRLERLPATKRALVERLLAARAGERAAPIGRRPDPRRPAPLSFQQRWVWARELAGFRPTSAIPSVLRLPGDLDAGAMAAAWHQVCARHQALRTVFDLGGAEGPTQAPNGPEPGWELVDLAGLGPAEAGAELRRLTEETTQRPFDLVRGPLARARLVRLAAGDHVMVASVHHLVNDAWSQLVLFRELRALYRGLRGGGGGPLPELALHYPDYAAWQREAARAGHFDAQLDHWERTLAGAPASLEIPRRPEPEAEGALRLGLLDLRLPGPTLAALREASRSAGASVFMTLLAIFAAAVAATAGQDDVVVGTPAAARSRSELEGVVGFFANLLPIRLAVDRRRGLPELVARARVTASEAFARQDVPIELVLERTGARPPGPGRTPLFQVILVLQNVGERMARQAAAASAAAPAQEAPDATGEPALFPFLPFYSPSGATFDLAVQLIERPGGLAGNLEYDSRRIEAATAEAVRARLLGLLRQLTTRPEAPLAAAFQD